MAFFYTLGDPAGLGPELVVRFYQERAKEIPLPLVMVGLEEALWFHAQHFAVPKFWRKITSLKEVKEKGIFLLEPQFSLEPNFIPGRGTLESGLIAGESLTLACRLLKEDPSHILITGPLNKARLQEAGFLFPGHTEFLANFWDKAEDEVCMHFWSKSFSLSLVTTHPPLKEVAGLITEKRILNALQLTWDFMQKRGLTEEAIGVCGLNPHAGEEGKIGEEEVEIIAPALEKALGLGINCQGPFPADTLFHRALKGEFKVILAMYHDQGLAPLKLLHFGECVNITLGLPVLRLSVDHGTGYDLVGTGKAKLTSLKEAFNLALQLKLGLD